MRNRPRITLSDDQASYVRGLVVHDADGLLAFNKPSGLPVQTRGNRGTSLDHLLWAFARSNGKRPRLVHRIDAGTSGLVLAAQTQPLAAALSQQFADRKIKKRYLAIVSGQIPQVSAGRCETPLLKQGRMSRPGQLDQGADAARTDWRILERWAAFALIEARPVTGRMHQIRAHLASLGMPIVGDTIYGAVTPAAPRLMLHAEKLEVDMPVSGRLQLTAPQPAQFLEYWQRMTAAEPRLDTPTD